MAWAIDLDEEVAAWMTTLGTTAYEHVIAALQALAEAGPALGRPFVDTVKGSRHANMKELRPRGGNLRLLFAFDPRRHAVVVVAGDKSNDWSPWYERNIPLADQRFTAHLSGLERRGDA